MEDLEKSGIAYVKETYPEATGWDPLRPASTNAYSRIKEAFVAGAMSEESKAFHTQGLYTEEEVLQLMINAVDYIDAGMPTMESEIRDWFEQNKKKS